MSIITGLCCTESLLGCDSRAFLLPSKMTKEDLDNVFKQKMTSWQLLRKMCEMWRKLRIVSVNWMEMRSTHLISLAQFRKKPTMGDPAVLKKVSVSLPFGIGSAEWEADPNGRRAAWSLYVELVTRVSVEPLESGEGVLREALNSLYSLFGTTREILKAAGPDIGASHNSVGGIAVAVLNRGLRPFLTKWHPRLQFLESSRPNGVSPSEHERQWTEEPTLRRELEDLRKKLSQYASALAIIADVDD